MTIMEELRSFLEKENFLEKGQTFDESDSLIENGVLDSVGMLSLINFIESKYSISIDEEDLMPENFDSLKAIKNYVSSLLNK